MSKTPESHLSGILPVACLHAAGWSGIPGKAGELLDRCGLRAGIQMYLNGCIEEEAAAQIAKLYT